MAEPFEVAAPFDGAVRLAVALRFAVAGLAVGVERVGPLPWRRAAGVVGVVAAVLRRAAPEAATAGAARPDRGARAVPWVRYGPTRSLTADPLSAWRACQFLRPEPPPHPGRPRQSSRLPRSPRSARLPHWPRLLPRRPDQRWQVSASSDSSPAVTALTSRNCWSGSVSTMTRDVASSVPAAASCRATAFGCDADEVARVAAPHPHCAGGLGEADR